ncbi:Gfo/Idh/MocA family protein [Sulfuriroseicoccus oceanibius]|uniref:Gfo/Idh/MocA family oxidoreductase n=1 Tax=Sulfuriroseicoccus oceanibius TaxID=2707525 RepID=A0A6B3L2U8_9BACT|nr:Gfo/Idh/MocA family oxidoreductase [Sulfuriroseicoccus oceanibius]QQL44530.1 Gfo/Idh/MocA family oxidoreductase [Sulfuriroseicoccus oceanibius]
MSTTKPLTIATVGCGSRALTYMKLAASRPEQFQIVAAADPIPERVAAAKEISQNPEFRSFDSADALLAEPKLADILIIGTQDNYHYGPAKTALLKDYHLLLEKPATQDLETTEELAAIATERGLKVVLCFVLRYTAVYRKIKEIVDSGRLGDIISLRASEGVGAFHQVHSFVRGHWAKSQESTPMIVAKCSHDMDIIAWIMGEKCKRVSSFGNLTHFHAGNRPEGSPDLCTDGDNEHKKNCPYCALRYLDEDMEGWLKMVYPDPEGIHDKEAVLEWLKNSPWARNPYACDNDVVDHQVVNMEFVNGTTAALTMTAFDQGRSIEIYGTKASLRGGDANKLHFGKDIVIRDHISGEIEEIEIKVPEKGEEGYGHGGGDFGLIDSLYQIITENSDSASLIENSVEGHRIAFAAEASRLSGGTPVNLAD